MAADGNNRVSSIGLYRLWRDLGFVVGGLLSGLLADVLGIPAALHVLAMLAAASGVVVALVVPSTFRGGWKG